MDRLQQISRRGKPLLPTSATGQRDINSGKKSNSNIGTAITGVTDEQLSIGLRKLNCSGQLPIQLEGLHAIYAKLAAGLPCSSRKGVSGGSSMTKKDIELARGSLILCLTGKQHPGQLHLRQDVLLLQTSAQIYIHRLIKSQQWDMAETLGFYERLIITTHSHLSYDGLNLLFTGLHQLLLLLVYNVARVVSSPLQPISSYLPPNWTLTHPFLKLINSSIDTPAQQRLYTEFMVRLVQKDLPKLSLKPQRLQGLFYVHEPVVRLLVTSHPSQSIELVKSLLLMNQLNAIVDDTNSDALANYLNLVVCKLLEVMYYLPLDKSGPDARWTLLSILTSLLFSNHHAKLLGQPFTNQLYSAIVLQHLTLMLQLQKFPHHHLDSQLVLHQLHSILKHISDFSPVHDQQLFSVLFAGLSHGLTYCINLDMVDVVLDLLDLILSSSGAISHCLKQLSLQPMLHWLSQLKVGGPLRAKLRLLIGKWFGEFGQRLANGEVRPINISNLVITIAPKHGSDILIVPEGELSILLAQLTNLDSTQFLLPRLIARKTSLPNYIDYAQQPLSTTLAILLYVLQVSPHPQTKRDILLVGLPYLLGQTNQYLVPRILKFTTNLYSSMPELVIRSLYQMVLKQPRGPWRYLCHYFNEWIKSYKQRYPRRHSERSDIKLSSLDGVMLMTLHGLSVEKPHQLDELVPGILSLVQYAQIPYSSLTLLIEVVYQLSSLELVDIGPCWTLIIKPLVIDVDQYNVGNGESENNLTSLKAGLIDYMGLLVTDSSEALADEISYILNEQLLPKISPSTPEDHQEERGPFHPQVTGAALRALSKLPLSALLAQFNSPDQLLTMVRYTEYHVDWQTILASILDWEINTTMTRTQFKGITINNNNTKGVTELDEKVKDWMNGLLRLVNLDDSEQHRVPVGLKPTQYLVKTLLLPNVNESSVNHVVILRDLVQLIKNQASLMVGMVGLFEFFLMGCHQLNLSAYIHYFIHHLSNPSDRQQLAQLIQSELKDLIESQTKTSGHAIQAQAILAWCSLPLALIQLNELALARSHAKRVCEMLTPQSQSTTNIPNNNEWVIFGYLYGLSNLLPCLAQEPLELDSLIQYFIKIYHRYQADSQSSCQQRVGEGWVVYHIYGGLARIYDTLGHWLNQSALQEGLNQVQYEMTMDQIAHLVHLDSTFDEKFAAHLYSSQSFYGKVGYFNSITSIMVTQFVTYQTSVAHSGNDSEVSVNPFQQKLIDWIDCLVRLIPSGSKMNDEKKLAGSMWPCLARLACLIPQLYPDRANQLQLDQRLSQLIQPDLVTSASVPAKSPSVPNSLINMSWGTYLFHRRLANPPPTTQAFFNRQLMRCFELIPNNSELVEQLLLGLLGVDQLGSDPLGLPNYLNYSIHSEEASSSHNGLVKGLTSWYSQISDQMGGTGNIIGTGSLNQHRIRWISLANLLRTYEPTISQGLRCSSNLERYLLKVYPHLNINNSEQVQNQKAGWLVQDAQEPMDYSRFDRHTSYLRSLVECIFPTNSSPNSTDHKARLMLSTLLLLNHPIPPLNWSGRLRTLLFGPHSSYNEDDTITVEIQQLGWRFVVQRMQTSNSLADLFWRGVAQPIMSDVSLTEEVRERGLIQLAKLAGLIKDNRDGKELSSSAVGNSWLTALPNIDVPLTRFNQLMQLLLMTTPAQSQVVVPALNTLIHCTLVAASEVEQSLANEEIDRFKSEWQIFAQQKLMAYNRSNDDDDDIILKWIKLSHLHLTAQSLHQPELVGKYPTLINVLIHYQAYQSGQLTELTGQSVHYLLGGYFDSCLHSKIRLSVCHWLTELMVFCSGDSNKGLLNCVIKIMDSMLLTVTDDNLHDNIQVIAVLRLGFNLIQNILLEFYQLVAPTNALKHCVDNGDDRVSTDKLGWSCSGWLLQLSLVDSNTVNRLTNSLSAVPLQGICEKVQARLAKLHLSLVNLHSNDEDSEVKHIKWGIQLWQNYIK